MYGWLLTSFGVAISSAVIPLISVELFLIALVTREPHIPFWALGLCIGVGQVAGKLLYYYAARGSIALPEFLRKRMKPREKRREHPKLAAFNARWRHWLAVLRDRCHQHPNWMVGTHAVSSLVGLPPFMATTVLAGLVRMPVSTFLIAGLTGRIIRFSLLAASPAMIAAMWG